MKKNLILAMCATICMLAATACGNKEEKAPVSAPAPVEKPAYQPKHTTTTVDLTKGLKKYNYVAAPTGAPAVSVSVDYGKPYTKPTTVKFVYANGDTRTLVVPADFGLWNNSKGTPRVVTDKACTVWLQGQTKKGKFCEFVFFGDPQYNGKKVKPNSYRGEIKYRK